MYKALYVAFMTMCFCPLFGTKVSRGINLVANYILYINVQNPFICTHEYNLHEGRQSHNKWDIIGPHGVINQLHTPAHQVFIILIPVYRRGIFGYKQF